MDRVLVKFVLDLGKLRQQLEELLPDLELLVNLDSQHDRRAQLDENPVVLLLGGRLLTSEFLGLRNKRVRNGKLRVEVRR